MLSSLHSLSYCPGPSTRALKSFPIINPSRVCKVLTARCCSSSSSNKNQEPVTNFGGAQLEETVDLKEAGKLRLDSWISSRIVGISRARVQSSIRSGRVSVNGRVINKVSLLLLYFDSPSEVSMLKL